MLEKFCLDPGHRSQRLRRRFGPRTCTSPRTGSYCCTGTGTSASRRTCTTSSSSPRTRASCRNQSNLCR